MSLLFVLGLTGPGDGAGPSLIHDKSCKGQGGLREKGKGRDGNRGQHLSSMQWEKQGEARKNERDLCDWGGDRCETVIEEECVWGQRQPNDCRDTCPVLQLSLQSHVKVLTLPGLHSGPHGEPKQLRQTILSWHGTRTLLFHV